MVANAGTDHARALALQNYFLDPGRFTYDLTVATTGSVNDMESFLESGRGYCEQFASTYAAMARSIGLPARVAVGFTWGDWDPVDQEYEVRGRHAHAWPEVYFADVGWVVFDPTPGRSRGNDGGVTGLDTASQAAPNGETDGVPDSLPPSTVPSPTGTGPDAEVPPRSGSAPDRGNPDRESPLLPGDLIPDAPSRRDVPWGIVAGLATVAAAVMAVPLLRTLLRVRRRRRAAAHPQRIGELAWYDAVDATRLVGAVARPHQTPLEFAATTDPAAAWSASLRELAERVSRLRYSPGHTAATDAQAASDASSAVVQACRSRVRGADESAPGSIHGRSCHRAGSVPGAEPPQSRSSGRWKRSRIREPAPPITSRRPAPRKFSVICSRPTRPSLRALVSNHSRLASINRNPPKAKTNDTGSRPIIRATPRRKPSDAHFRLRNACV
ncbi:MAG: transglutaminase-like domain-containing protein [Acidimicrobiales bacterium]